MQKKKSGVKKCLEIRAIKGGGVGPLMANAILNFHFDYVTTSLTFPCKNLLLGGHICSIIMILVTRLTDVISDQKNNWYLGMFVFLLYVLGGAVAHTQVFLQKVH